MKRLWVFLFFVLLALILKGGEPMKTSWQYPPHIWEHYQERLRLFREENQRLKTTVFLGDSLTEGFPVEKYFPELNPINRGIIADHIGVQGKPGVLQRLKVSVYDANPSRVFLLIGVNDLADKDHNFSELVKGYRQIIKEIKTHLPEVKIYVQSCLPTRGKYAYLNPLIKKFNAEIKKIASETGCPFIDLYPLMCDKKGELRQELTRDGLHLNEKGNDLWAKELKKVLFPTP